MSSDSTDLEADSVETDLVSGNDGYPRFGVPETTDGDDLTGVTGTYIRLGAYASTEEDYLPQDVGLTADASMHPACYEDERGFCGSN